VDPHSTLKYYYLLMVVATSPSLVEHMSVLSHGS
jgi:hypothetical protein